MMEAQQRSHRLLANTPRGSASRHLLSVDHQGEGFPDERLLLEQVAIFYPI